MTQQYTHGSFSKSFLKYLNIIASKNLQTSSDEKEDFVNVMIQHARSWNKEKIEIYLASKSFFSGYVNRIDTVKSQMCYQDLFEKILKPILEENFVKAKDLVSDSEKENMTDMYNFMLACLESFINDGLYIQVYLQRQLLNDYTTDLEAAKASVKTLFTDVEQTSLEVKDQSKKLSETSISVLGIFVGVVMVFFGGFAILENAIEGMSTATPYRLAITMLLFGGILFNIVILLFFLVGKLTQKTIICDCYRFIPNEHIVKDYFFKLRDENDDDNYKKASIDSYLENAINISKTSIKRDCSQCMSARKFVNMCRARHLLPYAYWGNVVILVLAIFVFFMYAFHTLDLAEPIMQSEDSDVLTFLCQLFHWRTRLRVAKGVTFPQVLLSSIITISVLVFLLFLGQAKKRKKVFNKLKRGICSADTLAGSNQNNNTKAAKHKKPYCNKILSMMKVFRKKRKPKKKESDPAPPKQTQSANQQSVAEPFENMDASSEVVDNNENEKITSGAPSA